MENKKPDDKININVNVSGKAQVRDVVGKKIENRPTIAREQRELKQWQVEHLHKCILKFQEAQEKLRALLKNPPKAKMPYKALYYYDSVERNIFFGRKSETDEFTKLILEPGNCIKIIHAPSGAGKTSLIRAGIIPHLLDNGHYCLWSTPTPYPTNLYKHIYSLVPGGPDYDDVQLLEFINWVTNILLHDPEKKLIIFVDQFERVFEVDDESYSARIAADLATCSNFFAEAENIRIVLSIRTDYLGSLDIIRNAIPNILDHRIMLEPLLKQQAYEAITAPVGDWGVTWQETAAQKVVDYLGRGIISTPHLQLICSQIYQRAIQENRIIITEDDVISHDLEMLHRTYLQSEMKALFSDENLGWMILKDLVTSQGFSKPRFLNAIEEAYGSNVLPVVDKLVDRWILRREVLADGKQIEIAHETLAKEIITHETPDEIRIKATREMINRGLTDWLELSSKPLMGIERLKILDNYSDVLESSITGGGISHDWTSQVLEYILRSALGQNYHPEDWFNLALKLGVDLAKVVYERLQSSDYKERVLAVNLIQKIGVRENVIIPLLSDEFPQVRLATIKTLEKMGIKEDWKKNLKYECYVPGGDYLIGNNYSDQLDEKPAHEIHVDGFYIGKYPVTNRDYKLFSDDVGQVFSFEKDTDLHPVVNVSWFDAVNYARWANMRLLTEVEWEIAASFGKGKDGKHNKRLYPWGDLFNKHFCNSDESGIGSTTAVNKYSNWTSHFGCIDMVGNVWEWTSSIYREFPYTLIDGREDPNNYDPRVLRGGAYNYPPSICRTTYRGKSDTVSRYVNRGFRVGFT